MRRLFLLSLAYLLCVSFSQCALAQSVTEKTLYSPATNADLGPPSALAQGQDGNLYGFINGDEYSLTTAGAYTSLASEPYGSALVQGPNGDFYGTTTFGGGSSACISGNASGCGTIFEVSPDGGLNILYAFPDAANGSAPVAPLILGSDGNFYGTTTGDINYDEPGYGKCGASTCGTIFQISPTGHYSVVYIFTGGDGGGYPIGGLLQASDGNFYGTTTIGGDLQCADWYYANGCGTIFQLTPQGKLTTLYTFTGGYGSFPTASLTEGSDGNLHGTTAANVDPDIYCAFGYGEGATCGIIFKIDEVGKFTTIYTSVKGDGTNFIAGLFPGSNGDLFGAAEDSGGRDGGEVFEISSADAGDSLFQFPDNETPLFPYTTPLQASDGNLYGALLDGGPANAGGIYKLTLSPAQAAPVRVTASATSVSVNTPVTLTWTALNAFSVTMQQCYAFLAFNGTLTPLGLWSGTYNSANQTYGGSVTVTPAAQGTYRYAVTCGGIESNSVTLTAGGNQALSTTTLKASPNPTAVGQTISLTATVSSAAGGSIPTGTVSFAYAGMVFAKVALNAKGVAKVAASSAGFAVGSYNVTASYSGGANYTPSGASTSVVLDYFSTTTLTASPNPVLSPHTVTLMATVQEQIAFSDPTQGVVKFYAGTTLLASASFNANCVGYACSASYTAATTSIPPGTYPVTAVFEGYGQYAPSTSPVVNVTVR
jgi:uncharacterized repeat protein (TIGR03803 family)